MSEDETFAPSPEEAEDMPPMQTDGLFGGEDVPSVDTQDEDMPWMEDGG